MIKDSYTIKELSNIFQLSPKATIRHLRHLDVPVKTKERFKSHVLSSFIKSRNPDLYQSIELTVIGKTKKPFFTVRDLCPLFSKTHSGMYRWLKRNELPTIMCGNKTVLMASVLLKLQAKSVPN